MKKYIAITEAALDHILLNGKFLENFLPCVHAGGELKEQDLSENIHGYFMNGEPEHPYVALINTATLHQLRSLAAGTLGYAEDVYRRIARVVKGLKSPPIHLPRQWSEYHYKNLLAFFALPKAASSNRWIADMDGINNCIRFDFLAETRADVDLVGYSASPWPVDLENALAKLSYAKFQVNNEIASTAFAAEVDLKAIGSASIVNNRTYEEWQGLLSESQQNVLNYPTGSSMRIIGPAGSGKTLALCLRAIKSARSPEVRASGKKILVATHSWAMAERIDGVLTCLNGGVSVDGISIWPLLYLLQEHAGHIGSRRTEVIGDDSTDGRHKSIDIIKNIISSGRSKRDGMSTWISDALDAGEDSRARLELVINLYEEISGVLTASAVALDDQESIEKYLRGDREDWMPPFTLQQDRGFVIGVYRDFLIALIDRSSITTDQFVLDSIRVLETFAWRMKKETEGYDFIFVDELQLFDAQERGALELLARGKKGVPFITAEDPSQGVFSSLHSRKKNAENDLVYLDTVHRFNKEIFELIGFIYQKFPLNTLPLKIDKAKPKGARLPELHLSNDDASAINYVIELASRDFSAAKGNDRICVATLGDVDDEISALLEANKLPVTRLSSFDDVEQLSYSKRSIVVAPWQFVGGVQFSHVIVVCAKVSPVQTQFGKRRELTSVYLSCSRAADFLSIVCSSYVPSVLVEARELGYLQEHRQ